MSPIAYFISDTTNAYGWSGWTGRDQYGNPYTQSLTGTINGVITIIPSTPLYLLRSGLINNGKLNYIGNDGRYWSSIVNSDSKAYYLLFHSGGVYPSDSIDRFNGFSIRCVAR